jgi:hypothetical protein
MKPLELLQQAGFEAIQTECVAEDVTAGYTSDLLSDVMANAPAGSVLITIQAHKNTVAVATLANIRAIIVCNGRPVPSDMIDAARQEKVGIFRTADNQFVTSHKVHELLFGK